MDVSLHLTQEDLKRTIIRQLEADGYEVSAISFRMSSRDYNSDPEIEATVVLKI